MDERRLNRVNTHIVKTYMGEDAYYAHCVCDELDVHDENWIVVSSAIAGHFNLGLLKS